MNDNIQVVFLIGAARSGTKLLRTILSQSEKIGAIEYDMNYIWKYGHYDIPHDEFNHLSPSQKEINFIKNFVFKKAKKQKVPMIIEKTVSNCLRIEYIKKVFPDAKIIHLYRDGRDVALSAKQRWEGSAFDPELQSKKEILQKVLDLPLMSVMPYMKVYVKNNIKHMLAKESKHIESWGPVYAGLEEDKKRFSLLEVCAKQWVKSVESTLNALQKYEKDRDYIEIKYEELLSNAPNELEKIETFLGISDIDKVIEYARVNVKPNNSQKWKKLDQETLEKLDTIIRPTMQKLGYL